MMMANGSLGTEGHTTVDHDCKIGKIVVVWHVVGIYDSNMGSHHQRVRVGHWGYEGPNVSTIIHQL